MFCSKCGSRLDGDAATCRQCGAAADAAEYCGGFWGLVGEKNAPGKTSAPKTRNEEKTEKPRAAGSGRFVAVLLVTLMLAQLLGTFLCYTRLSANTADDLTRRLEELGEDNEQLAQQLDELEKDNEQLAQQNAALQKTADELLEELRELKNALIAEESGQNEE